MTWTLRRSLVYLLAWSLLQVPLVSAAQPKRLLDTIRNVKPDGNPPRETANAWRQLSQLDPRQLPMVLSAMDDCTPLAANWLRGVVDSIAQRALSSGGNLPAEELEQFVLDTGHDPRARRLAFEWLVRVDSSASDRLVPGMLHDPSVEFRRDAVDRLLRQGRELLDAEDSAGAAKLYRNALNGARDDDQIKTIVKQLRSLGHEVDLPRHFGFLMHWNVIGPFDNTERKGFDVAYPPEQQINLYTEYAGKGGSVRWKRFSTDDNYGMVDLNIPLGKLKETVAYAWTEFTSNNKRPVELRLGCKNAWKVWLNGRLLFSRDEYHRGMQLDQYHMKGTLKAGRNDILLKVCQNEQVEDWTVEWQFQIRVCDATGTAILSTTRREDR